MWYIDVALSVHVNMKSHTGAVFTMEKGDIIISPTKEKINLQSSIESELIGVDEKISKVLYMNHFQECQVFPVQLNIIYQDNTSSIKLEDNG